MNVISGGVSTSDVTVKVSDSLSITKSVTLNGKVCAWPSNGTFSKAGKYVITVKDQYGLTTKRTFTIKKATVKASVTYSVHVQTFGWLQYVKSAAKAGTTGKKLRLEALKLKFTGNVPKGASITYQVYVTGKGWMTGKNGTIAGTTDHKLRVESVRISVSGLKGYYVKYKVHINHKGWQSFVKTKNGTKITSAAAAGKAGSAIRVEAIKIQIVKA